ncbi:hypothetical protein GPEL0_01f0557, partial [Geoanaerobacter pelophilus]
PPAPPDVPANARPPAAPADPRVGAPTVLHRLPRLMRRRFWATTAARVENRPRPAAPITPKTARRAPPPPQARGRRKPSRTSSTSASGSSNRAPVPRGKRVSTRRSRSARRPRSRFRRPSRGSSRSPSPSPWASWPRGWGSRPPT